MGLFDNWPYTDFHRLNLDWVIKQLKGFQSTTEAALRRIGIVEEQAQAATRGLDAANERIDDSNRRLASVTNALHSEISGLSNELDNLTAEDVGAIPLTGSVNITGALQTTGDVTGHYLTGEWFRTTGSNRRSATPNRFAILDDSGWVYYRTLADMRSDIAGATFAASDLETAGYNTYMSGVHLVAANAANAPTNKVCLLTVYGYGLSYRQEARPLSGTETYVRTYNGSWGAWTQH